MIPVDTRYTLTMPSLPKPGGAVFSPRTFATNTRKFGNSTSRLDNGPIASPQQAAAELQHALTNRIREFILDSGHSLRSFAETKDLPVGITYDRMQRISRGETMMTLTDLMFWAQQIPHFGQDVEKAVTALTEPNPSAS